MSQNVSLTFTPLIVHKEVTVIIVDDVISESDETFTLNLSVDSGLSSRVEFSPSTARVEINGEKESLPTVTKMQRSIKVAITGPSVQPYSTQCCLPLNAFTPIKFISLQCPLISTVWLSVTPPQLVKEKGR